MYYFFYNSIHSMELDIGHFKDTIRAFTFFALDQLFLFLLISVVIAQAANIISCDIMDHTKHVGPVSTL